ncbi:hypothetical protein LZC95_15445 [Pendulispora brunnea]|uniref:Uncharacterized protein n=1 Tax=Pendulispora brunnea TaxID=2905690 RepID=A0ABZ2KJI5_9BACT
MFDQLFDVKTLLQATVVRCSKNGVPSATFKFFHPATPVRPLGFAAKGNLPIGLGHRDPMDIDIIGFPLIVWRREPPGASHRETRRPNRRSVVRIYDVPRSLAHTTKVARLARHTHRVLSIQISMARALLEVAIP